MFHSKAKTPRQIQPIPDHASRVFSGFMFDVYQWPQELYDGSVATFEKLKRNDSAGVLPVTPSGKIVITRQEQPGLGEFLSVTGGVIEAGEDPSTAAYREMVEETGYDSDRLDFWFSSQYSSKIQSDAYYFVARSATPKFAPQPEPGEKIAVYEISFEEFVELIREDNFRDTAISLKVLRLIHDKKLMTELKEFLIG